MLLSKKWETVLTTRAPVVLKSKRIKVTLTTTKDKEFTGFCAWVKVESTKLCLNFRCSMLASWCERMFTWQPPRLIGWLQMAFLGLRPPATQSQGANVKKKPTVELDCVDERACGAAARWDARLLRLEVVCVASTAPVREQQAPFGKLSRKVLASLVKIGFGTPFALNIWQHLYSLLANPSQR